MSSKQPPASPLELRMSPNELAVWTTHKLLVERGTLPSCVNCELWSDNVNHFNKTRPGNPQHPPEVCTKWNRRPPAKVIVCGCDQHIPDIPF